MEQKLSELLEKHSIAYWLHAYRRLSPGNVGWYEDSHTTYLIRSTLEAAIQKYGGSQPCSGVAISSSKNIDKVFKGLLMAPEFELIREALVENPQLVLAEFGIDELVELYDLELLAHEMWRCGAALRIIGKGASLVVDPSSDRFFYDDRSKELDRLVKNYDQRYTPLGVTATGTVFPQEFAESDGRSGIAIPNYNVSRISAQDLGKLFQSFGLKLTEDFKPNFIWVPFNLPGYFEAHAPFSAAFKEVHKVSFDGVVVVIGALFFQILVSWRKEGGKYFLRHWQRAYDGPSLTSNVIDNIRNFLPIAVQGLGLDLNPDIIDVESVVNFLSLNDEKRSDIDLVLNGPHALFLPYDKDRVFVDYAWIFQILFTMFYGIRLDNQNFKGDALEYLVRYQDSVLPTGPCKIMNGEKKQVDAAFAVDDTLVIVECRAVGRARSVDSGDPRAIQYRIDKFDKALSDVDDKAQWLARNPVGTNYDIRKFQRVLPIAVSAFVEFIPSTDSHYWISDKLPRILTFRELRDALEDGALKGITSEAVYAIEINSKNEQE